MTDDHKRLPRRSLGVSTTDAAFDLLIPPDIRHMSETHWTPVDVAIRAATLLCSGRSVRVLDVGAGVGKLCAVGALSSAPWGATWCGVERDEQLVGAARGLVRKLGVSDRTMFVHGDVFSISWTDFDALYLYNPFELLLPSDDAPAERLAVDFQIQIMRAQERFATLRVDTRIVTLGGFGGVMPASYELVYQERVHGAGDLVLWIQGTARRAPERS